MSQNIFSKATKDLLIKNVKMSDGISLELNALRERLSYVDELRSAMRNQNEIVKSAKKDIESIHKSLSADLYSLGNSNALEMQKVFNSARRTVSELSSAVREIQSISGYKYEKNRGVLFHGPRKKINKLISTLEKHSNDTKKISEKINAIEYEAESIKRVEKSLDTIKKSEENDEYLSGEMRALGKLSEMHSILVHLASLQTNLNDVVRNAINDFAKSQDRAEHLSKNSLETAKTTLAATVIAAIIALTSLLFSAYTVYENKQRTIDAREAVDLAIMQIEAKQHEALYDFSEVYESLSSSGLYMNLREK